MMTGEKFVVLMHAAATAIVLGLMGVALYDGHAQAQCQRERAADTCFQALYR